MFGFSLFLRPGLAGTSGDNAFFTRHERQSVEIGTTSLMISPDSDGTASGDRAILRRGELRFTSANTYRVEASSFRITAFVSQTSGTVRMNPGGGVQVAALNGAIRVDNASGIELARLLPGETLDFQAGDGGSTAYDVNGCFTAQDGHFFVTDATTNMKLELHGADLAKYVGRRVRVTGNASPQSPAAGAPRIVDVSQITQLPGEVCGPAGSKADGGSHHVTKAVVIGGVVVGGTVGGLWGAGVFSNSPVSPSKP